MFNWDENRELLEWVKELKMENKDLKKILSVISEITYSKEYITSFERIEDIKKVFDSICEIQSNTRK